MGTWVTTPEGHTLQKWVRQEIMFILEDAGFVFDFILGR